MKESASRARRAPVIRKFGGNGNAFLYTSSRHLMNTTGSPLSACLQPGDRMTGKIATHDSLSNRFQSTHVSARSTSPEPQPSHGDESHRSPKMDSSAAAETVGRNVHGTSSSLSYRIECDCWGSIFRPLLRFSMRARYLRSASTRQLELERQQRQRQETGCSRVKPTATVEPLTVGVDTKSQSSRADGHGPIGSPHLDLEQPGSDDGEDYHSPSTDVASTAAPAAVTCLSDDVSYESDDGNNSLLQGDGEGGEEMWGEEGESEGEGESSDGSTGISFNLSLAEFSEITFLGQGSMCKCFLATGSALWPCPVVLKMSIENGPEQAELDLNRELAIMQNLSHPNLALLLGAGITPKGKTFIAMEYLDGGTLRKRLDVAMGGLGFWPGVQHALQLASAMMYLHDEAFPDMFVMHRDLKPDNVGFRNGVIKLFDLGLAKLVSRSAPGETDFQLMSGEVGSLRYMSPEVASLQPYTEKADVHSFGIVVWELVTGWLPYGGLSCQQFMFQAVKHGMRPLLQYGWDPAFKRMLTSCWAEDAKKRPSFSQIRVRGEER